MSFVLTNSAGTTVPSSASYNSSNFVETLTPSAALAYSTTYTASLSGAKDLVGNTMASVSWSFTTVPAPSRTVPSPSGATMVLQNFDGPTVPLNGSGDTYPSIYTGEGAAGTVSINTTDTVGEGNGLQANITAGAAYVQFNPDSAGPTTPRTFASYYANNGSTGGLSIAPGWQYNTYDHLSFWVLRPTGATPLKTGGQNNVEFGTYVKQITNADPTSDETGGMHYYHELNLPDTGQWTQVILNMYPQHYRGETAGETPTGTVYPTATNGPWGGDDPPNTYNYFDTLTRFYFNELSPGTGTFLFDDFQFYQSPYPQDDAQVSSLTGTYNPSNNEVTVTWDRPDNDNYVNDDVRYSFSDINQIGWNAATPAPNGILLLQAGKDMTGWCMTLLPCRWRATRSSTSLSSPRTLPTDSSRKSPFRSMESVRTRPPCPKPSEARP